MRSGPEFGNSSCKFLSGEGRAVLHQRLAASTWCCCPHPSIRKVGQNRETTIPEGPDHLVVPQSSSRSRETRVRFLGRVRPKDFKSWYSQLPCLTFSI